MNLWPFHRRSKAAQVVHPGGTPLYFLRNLDLEQTGEYDYGRRVGAGTKASVVMAPIQWVQRSMPEAPPIIERERAAGDWEAQPGHSLAVLLERPNPYYSGNHLLQATCFSYLTDGNAYWMIVRNGTGRPVELWYIPHWLIWPKFPTDGSAFLTGYTYRVAGREFTLDAKDVMHFRHGIDPENLRKGLSPLESVLREVWTDMEAAEFMATLLRNSGVPGLLIFPDSEGGSMDATDAADLKRYVRERTTGNRRGEQVVMSGKTKVERLAWNPREMDLSAATDRAEERVCALLGIPAAVVGFSAGLEQTKVGATMEELRRLAWQNGILPLHRTYAETIGHALLPDFGDRGRLRVRFETGAVSALQDDKDKLFTRMGLGVTGGWISVAAAKRAVGLTPEPGDEVYLRSLVVDAVPTGRPQPPRIEPAPKGLTGGNGKDTALERHVAATAPRARQTAAMLTYLRIQDRLGDRLADAMAFELRSFFRERLREPARAAALRFVHDTPKGLKQPQVDADVAARILEAMRMGDIMPIFSRVYEVQYLRVATEATARAMAAIGLATDLPDSVARAIQATGGTRAGLVDLSEQTRAALFRAIEEGRAEGEGAAALAERIGNIVEAGPWADVETRARVIARTETKYAQRVSTLHMAEGQGIARFRVFDARLGATDEACEALDGTVVSADEAASLAADEHPNGTRDFVPYFGSEE